ncbi:MAG: hypothetical protein RJA70_1631 [Pseudomonadota bacterium]
MEERGDLRQATARVLDREDADVVAGGDFYASQSSPPVSTTVAKMDLDASKRDSKPSHYKVICISMYTEDLKRLDRMVEDLKSKGLTKANRSALIRYALGEVDLDRVPKGL